MGACAGAPAGVPRAGPATSGRLEIHFAPRPAVAAPLVAALYDSAAAFAGQGRPLATVRIGADEEPAWQLARLPAGTYAVKAFLDLDRDGVLDRGRGGRPTEPYGFSNGARRRFGPPPWRAAAFEHAGARTVVRVPVE